MRTAIVLSFMLLIGVSSVKGQTTEEALEYMNSISESVADTKGETWRYLKSVTRGRSARTQERKREALIDEIGDVILDLNDLGPFKGDDEYRQEVISYLRMTRLVLNEDYGKIMNLEAIAEQSYDDMEAYLMANELASEKLDSAFSIYKSAQEDFAAKHNINLIEGEKSSRDEKIERAGNALQYYNRVFLVFFKASVQESYVMDALNRNDLISLEQSTQSLKAAAEEGLATLDTFSRYNADSRLIHACRRMMNFYISESEEGFPQFVDFYLAKDNFDRLRQVIESKDQDELTEEEIDAYNAAVEEYNEWVPVYNEVNEEWNEKRSQAHEGWEESIEEFFDEHA